MKRFVKWLLIALTLIGVAGAGGALWVGYYSPTSNPDGYATIGDIPAPKGCHRIGLGEGFARYLRALLLKPRGTKVELYTGGTGRFQSLNYAVVDLPLLSNAEQCADMPCVSGPSICMARDNAAASVSTTSAEAGSCRLMHCGER